jgi:hypothetical protein
MAERRARQVGRTGALPPNPRGIWVKMKGGTPHG